MRITRYCYFFVAAFTSWAACSTSIFAEELVYTKTASLPPLRITYAELQTVLEKSVSLMASTNSVSSARPLSEKLRLKHGESQIEITGHQLDGSRANLPKVATELSYTASTPSRLFRDSENAPVASVSMTFYDFDRRLTVEGTRPEQVDAVFAALKSDLLALSSTLGGSTLRTMSGLTIFILCFLILVYGSLYWLSTRQRRLVPPILLACGGIGLLFVLPFELILAGFSVSKFDPSFATSYGPELSLLGVVLTLAAIPLSYLLPSWFAKPADVKSSDVTANPSLKGTHRKRRAP